MSHEAKWMAYIWEREGRLLKFDQIYVFRDEEDMLEDFRLHEDNATVAVDQGDFKLAYDDYTTVLYLYR